MKRKRIEREEKHNHQDRGQPPALPGLAGAHAGPDSGVARAADSAFPHRALSDACSRQLGTHCLQPDVHGL